MNTFVVNLFLAKISFLAPFESLKGFISFVFLFFLFVLIVTSSLYFSLHKALEEEEDENSYSPLVHQIILLFSFLCGVLFYLFIDTALHSIKWSWNGTPLVLSVKNMQNSLWADILLLTGILGFWGGWARVFQILIIEDISKRYKKLIKTVPFISAFMILTFLSATWFFYQDVFSFLWYFLSFGLIYFLIYFLSLKNYLEKIKMYITRTQEIEDGISLHFISVAIGGVLLTLIVIPHLIFKTMPISYGLILFVFLWVVTIYMSCKKVFKQLRIFPRYATKEARLLSFARYTRRFLIAWFIISLILSFILGAPLLFDKGFSSPHKNLKKCEKNLKQIGEALEDYFEKYKALPNSSQWKDESWLSKVSEEKRMSFLPVCPSGGKYIYRKWRDKRGRPIFEIRCSCSSHVRSGVLGNYPKYRRFEGVVENSHL